MKTLFEKIRRNGRLSAAVLLLLINATARAEAGLQCPPQPPDAPVSTAAVAHPKGLLWEIERADARPSYIYGTIHISDEDVLRLAPPV